MHRNLLIRFVFYFGGLFIMALAISISVRSNLGVSPISSVPYTLTCVWGVELGLATILFHIALVLIQILLLRRSFQLRNLLQVPVGVVFGLFNTLCIYLTSFIPVITNIWVQLAFSLISSLMLSAGVFLYVPANIVPLAGEGTALALAEVTKTKFSTMKIVFDVSMVCIALVTCFVTIHSLGSVNIGTIIAAVLVGSGLKVITKYLGPARDRILAHGQEKDEQVQVH